LEKGGGGGKELGVADLSLELNRSETYLEFKKLENYTIKFKTKL
jgi:hypothetical protein